MVVSIRSAGEAEAVKAMATVANSALMIAFIGLLVLVDFRKRESLPIALRYEVTRMRMQTIKSEGRSGSSRTCTGQKGPGKEHRVRSGFFSLPSSRGRGESWQARSV